MAAISGQITSATMAAQVAQELYGKALPDVTYDRPNLAFFYELGNQAYQDVCNYFGWNWVFQISEFPTVIDQVTPYALDAQSMEILWMTIPALQMKLRKMQFRDWIVQYPGQYEAMAPGQPNWYVQAPMDPAVNNGERVYLGPGAADQVYTIRYGYLRSPASLTFGADEFPIIPAQWQELWKYRWLMKVYRFYGPGSDEKYQMAKRDWDDLYKHAWLADQSEADTVQRFRDLWSENAYGSALDQNRMLFFGGY